MIRTALIIAALILTGCERQVNPGALCPVVISDELCGMTRGTFDPTTGRIRLAHGLSQQETARVAMHEFAHACENFPGLRPRDVLRLYHSEAFPTLRKDLR